MNEKTHTTVLNTSTQTFYPRLKWTSENIGQRLDQYESELFIITFSDGHSSQYSRRFAFIVKLGGTGSFLWEERSDFVGLPMFHCTEETLVILVPFMDLKEEENT